MRELVVTMLLVLDSASRPGQVLYSILHAGRTVFGVPMFQPASPPEMEHIDRRQLPIPGCEGCFLKVFPGDPSGRPLPPSFLFSSLSLGRSSFFHPLSL